MSDKEIQFLKQTFGDNWKAGMRKNPHIDRVSEHEVNEAKRKRTKEQDKKRKQALLEGFEESYKKGKITNKMMNTAYNMLKNG